jgi:hypothetical protein
VHRRCIISPLGTSFSSTVLIKFINMRVRFLIIQSVLMFRVAVAQNGPSPLTVGQSTITAAGSGASVSPVTSTEPSAISSSGETTYIDYKSVYEAATIEEEVKMAAERFNLTKAQQDTWLSIAGTRREAEKNARKQLETKADNYERGPVYQGLRAAQTEFYQIIIGYLTPAQKNALEVDRLIMEEKRKQVAKLSPPTPVTPTVNVIPVDSAAIKAAEKEKATEKKSKKKKKTVGA